MPNNDVPEPTRPQIDAMPGKVLVEIGASWCGHCQATRPDIDRWLQAFPDVQHVKIEDGKGRSLGRTFGVKLWPTLVFMHQGRIVQQLVRPTSESVHEAFEALAADTAR
jgi:thioredoxin 1